MKLPLMATILFLHLSKFKVASGEEIASCGDAALQEYDEAFAQLLMLSEKSSFPKKLIEIEKICA